MAFFSKSSTQGIPETSSLPRHIAVIMDGNGRWAKKRFLPRIMGHQRGVESLKDIVDYCAELGVEHLTVFAFSSENWRRPKEEVSFLMSLFIKKIQQEVGELNQKNIRFRVIGDVLGFDTKLREVIANGEELTKNNTGLTFNVAANYGGRWDIINAVQQMLKANPACAENFSEDDLIPYLSLGEAPEPDLFIRTGGEKRISNFLLWQLAYTELYFTDTLWPAFDRKELDSAIAFYQKRERRFGRISEQVTESASS